MKKNIILFLLFCLNISLFCQNITLKKIGTYSCGKQPKQVIFSPDNKYIIMPLLEDNGFDIFSIKEKKIIRRTTPPNDKKVGFAEGLFVPQKGSFFVSQMTTANIYEYNYPGFLYKRTIPTKGIWSKFIAYDSYTNYLAVSNWVSNDISILDYNTGKLIKKIPTAKAPRGIYFINQGKEIISLAFDGGQIEKFDTKTWKKTNSIKVNKSAMRHIVLNKEETKAYVSDMYYSNIYEVDLKTFKITRQTKVFDNPNTIDLLKNKYLFVSSRGPNNPKDYTKRSPTNGKIQIIDVSTMKIIQTIEGGNQPTGLDVSDDGKYLCFSNFQDQNIELYEIKIK